MTCDGFARLDKLHYLLSGPCYTCLSAGAPALVGDAYRSYFAAIDHGELLCRACSLRDIESSATEALGRRSLPRSMEGCCPGCPRIRRRSSPPGIRDSRACRFNSTSLSYEPATTDLLATVTASCGHLQRSGPLFYRELRYLNHTRATGRLLDDQAYVPVTSSRTIRASS